jgi:aconitate hydratase
MGAEIGATTSLFGYDDAMARYLKATGREAIADAADAVAATCGPTTRSAADPAATSTRSSRSTSTSSEPHINGPHTPDLARPVSEVGAEAAREGWPLEISSPGRLVHQLLLRGHHPGRVDRPPGRRAKGLRAKTPS